MEVAKCQLKLNQLGSNVPLFRVTPAEVLVLRAGHEKGAGGDPISGVEIVGEIVTTSERELARLTTKYSDLTTRDRDRNVSVVKSLYPGVSCKLPETFKEIGINAQPAKTKNPENYAPRPADYDSEDKTAAEAESDLMNL